MPKYGVLLLALLAPIAAYADMTPFLSCQTDADCVLVPTQCAGWQSTHKEKQEDAKVFYRSKHPNDRCAPPATAANKPHASVCYMQRCFIDMVAQCKQAMDTLMEFSMSVPLKCTQDEDCDNITLFSTSECIAQLPANKGWRTPENLKMQEALHAASLENCNITGRFCSITPGIKTKSHPSCSHGQCILNKEVEK